MYKIPEKRKPTWAGLYLDTSFTNNEKECVAFVDRTINVILPDPVTQSELFNLVKTYQVHLRTCCKYRKNKKRFSYGRFATDKTVIYKPLDAALTIKTSTIQQWNPRIKVNESNKSKVKNPAN